jgi:hypothetical protein
MTTRLRLAADLALLGFLMTLASLPLVTAGAAVAAGGAAIRHQLDHDSWPPPRVLAPVFRRALLPGLGVVALLGLLALDLWALGTGLVPGGPPVLVVTAAVALAAAGCAGLLAAAAPIRPVPLAAASGTVLLAAVLTLLTHPLLLPVLAAYTLYALHALARRLT